MIEDPTGQRMRSGASATGSRPASCIRWVAGLLLSATAAGCSAEYSPTDARHHADRGQAGSDFSIAWDVTPVYDAAPLDDAFARDVPAADAEGGRDVLLRTDSETDAVSARDSAPAADARAPRPVCGDARCEPGETSDSCPPDCGVARPECMAPKDPFLNPFSKDSAHHRPIGADAVYARTDAPSTRDWLSYKAQQIALNVHNGWGTRVTDVKETDPLVTVRWDNQYGGKNLPVTLRVPRGFSGGDTADAGAVVYDRGTETLHEFYRLHLKGGALTASIHSPVSAKSIGHGGPGLPSRPGVTATGIMYFFGLLRGHETNAPGYRIQHALHIALPRRPDHLAMMLSREIRWPATSGDGSMNQANNNMGHIPYGALLAIPPVAKGGPDLEALGLSEPGKRVAHALRDYGMYVTDGARNPAMRGDQFVSEAVKAQIMRDLHTLYRHVRMVENNRPDQLASGGGAPLAPNCAFDAS